MSQDSKQASTAPLTVPGIRTRLHVVIDRCRAGLPFYWKAEPSWGVPIGGGDCFFCGIPCWIIDRDGDHLVLQAKDAAPSTGGDSHE